MPSITKTSPKKTTTRQGYKSFQMRLTITPQIYSDIQKARKKYRYLDDVEIVKIFIGRGADLENLDDLSYLSNANWDATASDNAFKNSQDATKWLNSIKGDLDHEAGL